TTDAKASCEGPNVRWVQKGNAPSVPGIKIETDVKRAEIIQSPRTSGPGRLGIWRCSPASQSSLGARCTRYHRVDGRVTSATPSGGARRQSGGRRESDEIVPFRVPDRTRFRPRLLCLADLAPNSGPSNRPVSTSAA